MEESRDIIESENNEIQDVSEEKSIMDIQKEQMRQMNIIASNIAESTSEDRDKADELYDFMRDRIEIDNDKNPETRKAMSDALGHKMKGTDQMIELLKIQAKLINPNKGGLNVNINLGDYDEKKGRDTNKMIDIAEELRKDI